jgi:hypothetical protein
MFRLHKKLSSGKWHTKLLCKFYHTVSYYPYGWDLNFLNIISVYEKLKPVNLNIILFPINVIKKEEKNVTLK